MESQYNSVALWAFLFLSTPCICVLIRRLPDERRLQGVTSAASGAHTKRSRSTLASRMSDRSGVTSFATCRENLKIDSSNEK